MSKTWFSEFPQATWFKKTWIETQDGWSVNGKVLAKYYTLRLKRKTWEAS